MPGLPVTRFATGSRRIAALPLALLAGGCAAQAPAPPAPTSGDLAPVGRTCNPAAARSLVGKAASPETLEAARRLSGAAQVRTARPGFPESMDFNSGRLTVILDSGGTIVAFDCR